MYIYIHFIKIWLYIYMCFSVVHLNTCILYTIISRLCGSVLPCRVKHCNSRLPVLFWQRPGLPGRRPSARCLRPRQTTELCWHLNTRQLDAQQFWRQDLCRLRTTSLEQSAGQSQIVWSVIHTASWRHFYSDSEATAQCELFLTASNRNIVSYCILWMYVWRQDLCRLRTTSLEQSVGQSQTVWAVIWPVQAVLEDIFIRTVRPQHSVNCF